MEDIEIASLDAVVRVNVLALTRLSYAALSKFRLRGQGTIINVGSIIAFRGAKGASAYSGSKAYVLNFSRSLQMETEGSNIIVQVVLPGPVRTEFFSTDEEKTPIFPEESFISAYDMVEAALAGLDQGELVCIPTLPDITQWEAVASLQLALRNAAGAKGIPAARYGL